MIAVNLRPEANTLELIDALRQQMVGTETRITEAVTKDELLAVCREVEQLREQMDSLRFRTVPINQDWESLTQHYESTELLRQVVRSTTLALSWTKYNSRLDPLKVQRELRKALVFLKAAAAHLKNLKEKS